jgi:hypothetical protein
MAPFGFIDDGLSTEDTQPFKDEYGETWHPVVRKGES